MEFMFRVQGGTGSEIGGVHIPCVRWDGQRMTAERRLCNGGQRGFVPERDDAVFQEKEGRSEDGL